MALKQEHVKNTPLSEGKQTCFGSLAWCCKDSSPACSVKSLLSRPGFPALITCGKRGSYLTN